MAPLEDAGSNPAASTIFKEARPPTASGCRAASFFHRILSDLRRVKVFGPIAPCTPVPQRRLANPCANEAHVLRRLPQVSPIPRQGNLHPIAPPFSSPHNLRIQIHVLHPPLQYPALFAFNQRKVFWLIPTLLPPNRPLRSIPSRSSLLETLFLPNRTVRYSQELRYGLPTGRLREIAKDGANLCPEARFIPFGSAPMAHKNLVPREEPEKLRLTIVGKVNLGRVFRFTYCIYTLPDDISGD